MSLRYEQRAALLKSRDLLCDLLDTQKRPKTVKEMRVRVLSALRHFPMLDYRGEPIWSQDDFEAPNERVAEADAGPQS
jgi:hypothetical protein